MLSSLLSYHYFTWFLIYLFTTLLLLLRLLWGILKSQTAIRGQSLIMSSRKFLILTQLRFKVKICCAFLSFSQCIYSALLRVSNNKIHNVHVSTSIFKTFWQVSSHQLKLKMLSVCSVVLCLSTHICDYSPLYYSCVSKQDVACNNISWERLQP